MIMATAAAARTVSVQQLNCARGEGTTLSALQKFAGDDQCIALVIQEPHLDRHNLPPQHPVFESHVPPLAKPRCVTYVRKIPGLTATTVFSHQDSFLGTRIHIRSSKPSTHSRTKNQNDDDGPKVVEFTLYNFYSPGRPLAIANLLASGHFVPDKNSIVMGDLNAHDTWWYGQAGSSEGVLRNSWTSSK